VNRQSIPQTLSEVRAELVKRIGREQLDELHRQDLRIDLVAAVILLGLFAGGFVLVHHYPVWWVGIPVALIQGLLITLLGLLNHDLFVHRGFGGKRGSLMLGSLLMAPAALSFSRYRRAHLRHHLYVQAEEDPERYKIFIASRARRLLFCTIIGLKLAMKGAWTVPKTPYFAVDPDIPKALQRYETAVQLTFVAGMIALAFYSPLAFVYGYLLPVLIVTPTLNSLRILIEHAHMQQLGGLTIATYYRTGPISRVLFFWDSGDCHVVHHIYANIPFYRMTRALELFCPILEEWGLKPTPSFAWLVRGWFVRLYPHGANWIALDAQANGAQHSAAGAADRPA
jgi:fatty acid desaturase